MKQKIAIIGNPNSGKSTLFNRLTGSTQRMGNWPGVTVDKKVGYFEVDDFEIEIVDLPGVYSLGAGSSEDEVVVNDFINDADYAFVINVINATTMKKDLYLTLQLLERKIPLLLVLNMQDLVVSKGLKIDHAFLEDKLGCKTISLSAIKEKNFDKLKRLIKNSFSEDSLYVNRSGENTIYPLKVENALDEIAHKLENSLEKGDRKKAIELLEGTASPKEFQNGIEELLNKHLNIIEERYKKPVGEVLASARHKRIDEIINASVQGNRQQNERKISDKLDILFMNKITGFPIFLFIMYTMFIFSIGFGGVFQDFFELTAKALFVDGTSVISDYFSFPEWLKSILANGIGGGIQTVASLIPVIAGLYFFLSLLEDSGYMVRAAFLMNNTMKKIGLSGKALLPLVVGFGCNVPAISGTKIMEQKSDKIKTIMMLPFMSCSARLAIYAVFCTAFFPSNAANIIFVLYIVGILVAILTCYLLNITIAKNSTPYFFSELPDYRIPSLRDMMLKTYTRSIGFAFGTGKLIVVVFFIFHIAGSTLR